MLKKILAWFCCQLYLFMENVDGERKVKVVPYRYAERVKVVVLHIYGRLI